MLPHLSGGFALIVALLKSGPGRSMFCMEDFRPIGLLFCPAELWEQLALARLERRLRPALGSAQAGGALGADAAALRLVSLLQIRHAGQVPGAQVGSPSWT